MKKLFLLSLILMGCLISSAEEPERSDRCGRIGVSGTFDLNIPGAWSAKDKNSDMSYGGGLGAVYNYSWHSNWFVEGGITFGYDNISLGSLVGNSGEGIESWRISVPVSVGYAFPVNELMKLSPMAGVNYQRSLHSNLYGPRKAHDYDRHDIFRKDNFMVGVGVRLGFDEFAVDILGYFGVVGMFRDKSFADDQTIYDNSICVSAKYFFSL